MRITAGELRGRVLNIPDLPGLRPTPAKVRQALFNILGPVDDFRWLDLFSGSGVMALEAISRGASSVVSIEQDRSLMRNMEQVRDAWGVTANWQIKAVSVQKGLALMSGQKFDLVFADPPYRQGFAEKLPLWLDEHQISCAQLVIEESAKERPNWPAGWVCEQSRVYGDTCLHFLVQSS